MAGRPSRVRNHGHFDTTTRGCFQSWPATGVTNFGRNAPCLGSETPTTGPDAAMMGGNVPIMGWYIATMERYDEMFESNRIG